MPTPFACAPYIKTIGRGARGARGLDRDAARTLYAAILDGRVSDLELGAVLLAYRIKSESAEEIAGMLSAAQAHLHPLAIPEGRPAVTLASYNGARKVPNLLPLLALALAREGLTVLVQGVRSAPGRVSSAEVFAALNVPVCETTQHAQQRLDAGDVAFLPIDVLSPALARQIGLMVPLGVRNSAHTIAKLVEPFTRPSLRLVNYTHEAYFDVLADYFSDPAHAPGPGVLMGRGTEGEAVADTGLARAATWFHDGLREEVLAAGDASRAPSAAGTDTSAATTAHYIRAVLAAETPMPAPIAHQIACIVRIANAQSRTAAADTSCASGHQA